MRQLLILLLSTVLYLTGCQMQKENDQLKMENVVLKANLNRAQTAATTLDEIGTLMDSIDQARNALRIELEKGTSYENYTDRMNDIYQYVEESEAKIAQLETEVSNSSSKNRAYLNTIARLKRNLKEKTKQIESLKSTVESYKSVNKELLNMMDVQDAELSDLEKEIEMRQEELDYLENRMQELMINSQINQGDAYFARAEAIEEAARRTKLAPKKKKSTYQEALELYKKAKAFGHEGADAKITDLEKKIGIVKQEK
jgi:chromosome segregation ATPase